MRIEWRVLGGLFAAGAIFCPVAEAQLRSLSTSKLSPEPTPVGVTSMSISASGPGTVSISWSPVTGATYYMVWGDGLPATGQRVDPPIAKSELSRYVPLPSLSVSGLNGPGMGTWSVGAFLDPAVASSTPATPVTKVSHWITSGTSGLQQPLMPSPTYQAIDFNGFTEGAYNDYEHRVMRTNLPQEQVLGTCPAAIYVFLDGAVEPIPAAAWELNQTSTRPEYMFANINGTLHFRPPKVASITTAPTASNAWIFAANCRGEYTTALPFKIWPGDLHIEKAEPVSAAFGGSTKFRGGDQGHIHGWGMKHQYASGSQKVILETTFAVPGTGERLTPKTELQSWTGGGDRYVSIVPPVLTSLAPSTSALIDARVYVVRDGVQSNSIPICYQDDPKGIRVAKYGGC